CEMDLTKEQHRIVVRTGVSGPGHVFLEVSDDGVGMNEETKSKIFASFFSTKGSRGTGLGLLVTSKIVLEHGGEISFDSEPGVGSTFTIRMPSGTAADTYEESQEPDTPEHQGEQVPGL
ncbi:MAG: ATP-binding protein, partial [Desulfomonilaceae bacterium]|nr:ATP-binding protein [Desulfomonilaceae bacterium]